MKRSAMRLWLKVLVTVVIALVVGGASACLGIRRAGYSAAVRNGPWRTSLAAGSREAGIYTRAAVAIGGLFALSREETLYYTAFVDDAGDPLRASCDYLLEGKDVAARWWSLTVYGEDHFLVPNEQHRYSYNLANLARASDRSYRVHLSRTPEKKNDWLPTGEARFSVTLRVYNPRSSVYEHPDTTPLPSIRRGVCR
jgi:hypothetical protein